MKEGAYKRIENEKSEKGKMEVFLNKTK